MRTLRITSILAEIRTELFSNESLYIFTAMPTRSKFSVTVYTYILYKNIFVVYLMTIRLVSKEGMISPR
jgi:hypothetical protein